MTLQCPQHFPQANRVDLDGKLKYEGGEKVLCGYLSVFIELV